MKQNKRLTPSDVVFVSWFDASIRKSLTEILAGIDVPVSNWVIFIGALGKDEKLFDRNGFGSSDWANSLEGETYLDPNRVRMLKTTFFQKGRRIAQSYGALLSFKSEFAESRLWGEMGKSEKKSILSYELVGMIFIITLGSLFHFTFEWSDYQPIVGIFSAVNESVWEHLKIGFWPALVWALIEYRYIERSTNNFFFAKTVGIYLIPITIPILFYSYTAVLGESILVIDILTFVIAIIAGQLVSYKLLTYRKLPDILNQISIVAVVLLSVAFVLFTFYPPHLPLFKDPITGDYGIVNHVHSMHAS